MSTKLMKKYIDIIMESISYNSLQDAGEQYASGTNQVWYWKENLGNEMMLGYDALREKNKLPDVNNLSATHVLIGTLAENDLEKIYELMQAESWSPQNQAESLTKKMGVGHTNISTGDIIILNGNNPIMVDKQRFVNLATGEKL